MNRRGFLSGILAACAAPAIARASSLMPIKAPEIIVPDYSWWRSGSIICETVPEPWIDPAVDMAALSAELSRIVRRVYVPRMVDQIYITSPIIQALFQGVTVCEFS